MYLVSACLAGFACRYDGKAKLNQEIFDMIKKGKAIPFCPEQAGGLITPRKPCEMQGCAADALMGNAKIMTKEGIDCSREFIMGAKEGLRICNLYGISAAILKAKSPSCGYKQVYDGNFAGKLVDGNGVFAQLLHDNGMEIQTMA